MSETPVITIPLSKFQELVKAQNLLSALEDAGVDNWEGYSIAYRAHEEEEATLVDAFDRHG